MRELRKILFLAATCLLAAGGCGTSEYERRLELEIKDLKIDQLFAIISRTPSEIPNTGLSINLPAFIDGNSKAFTAESAEPNGQGKVLPHRLNPSFLTIPGLLMTYEMQGVVDGMPESVPFYCYLAAVPANTAGPDGKPLEESIQSQLATAFSAQPQWESVMCPARSGQVVEWRRISVSGPQPFLDFTGTVKSLAGIFEVYSKEVEGTRILLGWRYPAKGEVPVSEAARLTAGSLSGPGVVTFPPGTAPGAAPPAAPAAAK